MTSTTIIRDTDGEAVRLEPFYAGLSGIRDGVHLVTPRYGATLTPRQISALITELTKHLPGCEVGQEWVDITPAGRGRRVRVQQISGSMVEYETLRDSDLWYSRKAQGSDAKSYVGRIGSCSLARFGGPKGERIYELVADDE